MRLLSEQALSDALDWHLEPGVAYHVVSYGDVDALTFLRHIAQDQRLDYVILATWCMAQTDADGIARFDAPEAAGYTVHVLKAPEGFEGDDTEYAVPEQYADVAVTLRRAG